MRFRYQPIPTEVEEFQLREFAIQQGWKWIAEVNYSKIPHLQIERFVRGTEHLLLQRSRLNTFQGYSLHNADFKIIHCGDSVDLVAVELGCNRTEAIRFMMDTLNQKGAA